MAMKKLLVGRRRTGKDHKEWGNKSSLAHWAIYNSSANVRNSLANVRNSLANVRNRFTNYFEFGNTGEEDQKSATFGLNRFTGKHSWLIVGDEPLRLFTRSELNFPAEVLVEYDDNGFSFYLEYDEKYNDQVMLWKLSWT